MICSLSVSLFPTDFDHENGKPVESEEWTAVEDISVYEDAKTAPPTPAVAVLQTSNKSTPASNNRRSVRRGSYSVETPSQAATPKAEETCKKTPRRSLRTPRARSTPGRVANEIQDENTPKAGRDFLVV